MMSHDPRDNKRKNKEVKLTGAVARERIRPWDFPRPSPEIVARYLRIDDVTSTVSDILDRMGILGGIPGSTSKTWYARRTGDC